MKMSPQLVQSTLAALLFGIAIADKTDHVTSSLQIQMPFSLYKEGGYAHREALFGSPPYGGSITQTLFYDKNANFCNTDVVPPSWQPPFIVMVDRGGCSFVQKIRNSQHAGAAGVIIADNICVCTDKICMNATNTDLCETNEPIMADDGSGGDITIPAFLMANHESDVIKETLQEGQYVQLEMSWKLPQNTAKVNYELWTVPSDHVSLDFQKNWKTISRKFKKYIYFTPRQYVYDGIKTHCHGTNGQNMCYNLCTNSGRYCAMDPDGDLAKGTSGADVVIESLRRICIWSRFGDDGIGEKYWDYIGFFLENCDTPTLFNRKDCVKDAMKSAKIDSKSIDSCMNDSGGVATDLDRPNTQLDAELAAQEERGVVVLPTVFVNTAALRGSLSASTVITAICAGFIEGSAPEICALCADCPNKMQCVQNDGCTGPSPYSGGGGNGNGSGGTVSKQFFGLSLLAVCCAFSVGAYLHWKKSQDEMRDQVRGILSEYMPLDGGENEGKEVPMDFARRAGDASFT